MNPNPRRVTEGLHVLTGVLAPYVARELRAKLAEQAGDPALYDRVRTADHQGVPPGSDALRELFDACGPCLPPPHRGDAGIILSCRRYRAVRASF